MAHHVPAPHRPPARRRSSPPYWHPVPERDAEWPARPEHPVPP